MVIGRYTCCVIGDHDFISLIQCYWEKRWQARISESVDITIHVAKGSFECSRELPDGWSTVDEDGVRQAVYIQKGKIIFALGNIGHNEAIVRVEKTLDSYIRLGAHYGLMTALSDNCVGLHGVTLLCGEEVVILSAPSGTGKTTLAHLLEKHCEAIVINGDFALLNPTEDGVVFEPTPFCGSSGRCLNHRVRVDRVVFLEQSKTNEWRSLSGREAMTRFLSNAFVPNWDEKMRQTVQENVLKCISTLNVNSYSFEPTKEAAEVFFTQLQHIEEQSSNI